MPTVIQLSAEMIRKLRSEKPEAVSEQEKQRILEKMLGDRLRPWWEGIFPRRPLSGPVTVPDDTQDRDLILGEILATLTDPEPRADSFFGMLRDRKLRLFAAKALAKNLEEAQEVAQ